MGQKLAYCVNLFSFSENSLYLVYFYGCMKQSGYRWVTDGLPKGYRKVTDGLPMGYRKVAVWVVSGWIIEN